MRAFIRASIFDCVIFIFRMYNGYLIEPSIHQIQMNCIDIIGSGGQRLPITEWAGDTDNKIKNQLTRLRRWVKEVTGADTFPTTFASYEEMANNFCAAVNGKKTLLEVKLVYGSKGYLEMPKYDGCVRAMSNPSRLKLSNSESAKLVKPTATPSGVDELNAEPSLDF